MRQSLLLLIYLLFSATLFSQNDYFIKVKNDYNTNLFFNDNVDINNHPLETFLLKYNIQEIGSPFKTKDKNLQNTYLISVDASYTLEELTNTIRQYNFIEYLEPVPVYDVFYVPNDPLYSQQYALPLINAPLAWNIATCVGNSNVVLAIIDDAVRITHEDIAPVLWFNPNEIANNGIDDDNNGFIDDINGWDAADNDNDPSPPASATNAYFSHGTHVAGIAGGATDNSLGIASIGYGVQLMPVKIGANATNSLTGAWAGVDYAVACGYVDVVNMSWGGGGYSQTYQNLITAGHNQGITFVAAAGNSNTSAPMYPASYNHVISVAATNQTDTRASFSNYGATIDVAAPGVAILSTVAGADNAYDVKQGTSMASPLVAGLCALMKCYNYSATPDMIESCLKTTAVNIDAQNPSYINQLGAGRIDAQAALQCLSTSPIVDFYAEDTMACSGQPIQFFSQSIGVQPLNFNWSFPGGIPSSSTLQNPTVSYATTGNYSVTLTVTNTFGNDVLTKTNYITIAQPTATISGNTTIVSGGAAFLRVDFTGVPPFDLTYTDGTSNFTVTSIQYSPYYIQVNPTSNITYNLISMSNSNCSGTVNGSAQINITTATSSNCSNSYQFTLNDNADSEANAITLTQDGGYVVVGYTEAGLFGQEDIFLSKFNSQDVLIWNKIIGTADSEKGVSIHIVEDDSGELMVMSGSSPYLDFAGRTKNTTLIKLSANGTLLWEKNKQIASSSIYCNGRDLIYSNGSYYITGSETISNGGNTDAFLMKLDANGNTIWSSTFNGSYIDHSFRVIHHSNNNLYWGGSNRTFASGASTGNIHCSDDLGNALWAKKYDILNKDDAFNSFIETDNGDIICTGRTDVNTPSDVYLLRVTSSGILVWAKSLGGTDNDEGFTLKKLNGDNYILAGVTSSFGNGKQFFATKIDGQGNEIWTKILGGTQDETVYANPKMLDVNETSGYGILVGSTQSFGGSDLDPFIVKFNLDIEDSCSTQGILWTETTLSPQVQTISAPSTSIGDFVNHTMSVSNNPMVVDTSCFTLCIAPNNLACQFLKTYSNCDFANSINYNISSNQFYMSGRSTNGNLFVSNLDINGDVIWSRGYSVGIGNITFPGSLIFADNNSDILVEELNNDQIVIYRIDNAGNVVWNKRFQTGILRRPKLVNAGNNEYYLICWYAPSGNSDNIVVYKFDGNGNAIWSYQYHYADDQFNRVVPNGMGGLLMSGNLSSSAFILELDLNGNIIQSKIENGSNSSVYRGMYKDGNTFYVHGSEKSGINARFFIEKFDMNLNSIWKINSGWMPNRDIYEGEIIKDSAGDFYLFTPIYIGSTIQDELLIKFDAFGNIIKEKTSTINNSSLVYGTYVPNLVSGEIILAYTSPFFSNGNKVGLIKTDTALNSCVFVDTLIAFNPVSASMSPINFTKTNISLNVINDPINLQNESIAASFECNVNCNTNTSSLLCINLDSIQKISNQSGNFNAQLDVGDRFGRSITSIGDFNGDGIEDIAVGASYDDDGCAECGAIYLLYLNQDGTVNTNHKISNTQGGFTGTFTGHAGIALANVGDLDGNGVIDLAVGASQDSDGGISTGAVWILFLNASGNVINSTKLSKTTGASMLPIFSDDRFGISVANLGDVNNDGIVDIAVGATQNDNGGTNRGSVFILNLNVTGNITSFSQISSNSSFMSGSLDNNDGFGLSVAKLNDINGDGAVEILVGVNFDDDGGTDVGAAYIIYLDANGNAIGKSKISASIGNFMGNLNASDNFAGSVSNIGDIDNDGIDDIILGAFKDDDGNTDAGAIWLLTLNSNGTVKEQKKFSESTTALINLDATDFFASSIANIGDLNNDGINEIAAGAILDDDGGADKGAVYILYLGDTCAVENLICHNHKTDTLLCLGDSIQINITNASNISWTPNYNISDSQSASPILWPETDTTYFVYYEDSLCQYFDTIHVSVSIAIVQASFNDTLICPTQSVQLNASGANSYTWISGANLNNPSIPNPVFLGNVSETIIVVGQNQDGCTAVDSVEINVLSCCGAYADFVINDSVICVNESISFNNTSIAGNNATFTWNFGTGASPTNYTGQNPPAVTYSIPGIHQVQLILSDDCGQDTVTKNVYVNDLPLVNLSPDTSICGNDTVHFQLGDAGIADYTYSWTPSTGLDNPSIANPIASINYSETYSVLVVDNFTGCVNMDELNIYFANSGDNLIFTGATNYCISDSVLLYVNVAYDSLRWNNGSQEDTLVFELLEDTLIYVTVFIDSCEANDSLFLTADDIPLVSFDFDDTVCINSWDTINVSTTGIPVWQLNDTLYQYPVQIVSDTSLYLTTYNGICGTVDTIQIYVDTFPQINILSPIELNQNEEFQTVVDGIAESWQWTPSYGLSCANCQEPILSADSSIVYILEASNNGCVTYDTLVVTVLFLDNCLVVPTAFSPNNDAVNNVFRPILLDNQADVQSFRIYNRWGEKIHDSLDPWDGTYKGFEQNIDVYIYVINYSCNGESKSLTGNVTLIR